MGDVGRGAAHVEADDHGSNPASAAVFDHADDAAGRARTGSRPCRWKAAASVSPPFDCMKNRRAVAAERRDDLVDVAPQHRRQIGVDHRRVAAADQLDQRPDLVAGRDLGEADLARHLGQRRLVRGPAPAVHQHDGERAIARRHRPPAARRAPPSRSSGRSISPSAVTRSSTSITPLVERLGQDDAAREDVGPRLVADARAHRRSPAVIASDELLALALEQGVGGDGGPHLDRVERAAARLGHHPPIPSTAASA